MDLFLWWHFCCSFLSRSFLVLLRYLTFFSSFVCLMVSNSQVLVIFFLSDAFLIGQFYSLHCVYFYVFLGKKQCVNFKRFVSQASILCKSRIYSFRVKRLFFVSPAVYYNSFYKGFIPGIYHNIIHHQWFVFCCDLGFF